MRYLLPFLFLSIQLAFSKADQNDPAFKLYFKAYEFVLNENWESAILTFGQLADNHKSSNYVDDAHYWIAYATKEKQELKKSYDLYESFIKHYPNSNLNKNALRDMALISEQLIAQGEKNAKYIAHQTQINHASKDAQELQKSAVFAIYNQGGKEALDKLYTIAKDEKRPEAVREKAIFWYGQSEGASAKSLLQLYTSITSATLKEKCIFSLSQLDGEESDFALFKLAKNNKENKTFREKAIFWLSQSNSNKKADYFKSLLAEIKENSLREKIIFAIYNSDIQESTKLLNDVAFNKEEHIDVREKAIFWLGQKGSTPELKKLYMGLENEDLKEKIIFGFYEDGSDASIEFMIKLLKSGSTSTPVKKKLIFWLGQMESPKARKAIQDILTD